MTPTAKRPESPVFAIPGGWAADSAGAKTRPRGGSALPPCTAESCSPESAPGPAPGPSGAHQPRASGEGRRNQVGPSRNGRGFCPSSLTEENQRVLWSNLNTPWLLLWWGQGQALPVPLHTRPLLLHALWPWDGWISHSPLQQFVTGINTTKAFLKEKNSLRPKGKHGLNILILCADRVQMLPLILKKAHEATVKSFKTSKLRHVSRHGCRAFKPVTHRGTCSWARCVWWDMREHIPWDNDTFQIWKITIQIFSSGLPTTRRKRIAYSYNLNRIKINTSFSAVPNAVTFQGNEQLHEMQHKRIFQMQQVKYQHCLFFSLLLLSYIVIHSFILNSSV